MSTSVGEWVEFFVGAGIPSRESAQYAQTFHSHRISMEMLLDLNKEYLRDMGITVLGDIIAILKHAKEVQGNMTSHRVLQGSSASHALATPPTAAGSRPAVTPVMNPDSTMAKDTHPLPAMSRRPSGDHERDRSRSQSNANPVSPPTVSARLGPPAPRRFAEFKKDNVFRRLADVPVTQPEISSSRSVSMRPPEDTTVRSVFKRVGQATPTNGSSSKSNKSNPVEESRPKKKKYIMVRTLSDGSKIRQIVSPDDPILERVQVTKRVPSTPPSGAVRPFVATTRFPAAPPSSLSSSREPLRKKRKPISPPRDDPPRSSSRSYQIRRSDEPHQRIHERLEGGSRHRFESSRMSDSQLPATTQGPKRSDPGSSRMYSDDYSNKMSHRVGRKRTL
ncbi:uncharacterized protein C19orf47 homolog [Tigriopus californicus]|uniref:uncharacterized protein C19orf47 homolog n=1 Tax=Tigriopus californicus TaxID=6832 RepID=UPI0027DAA548|nr:uncharacterized protein C19orf47 homolog [Tigriopus californicus]|eukprot:TCALIF_12106-PA protein Name:"Similar to Uncharacterized protein C19orf47 homolog (Rattus norvegicus)" AED:0.00 eAED:0.00 QI:229/1/1/1/0.66/0.75/4/57/390